MTYKETILFIGKCLTINKDNKHHRDIQKMIASNQVDWDRIVVVATEHYVFPLLYLNLKYLNCLRLLPVGLKEFMRDVYIQNYERNQILIKQAKDINALLSSNAINVIFIKDAGLLLDDLYVNLGEKMILSIDILLESENLPLTIELFQSKGYELIEEMYSDENQNFISLVHTNEIAIIRLYIRTIRGHTGYVYSTFVKELKKIDDGINLLSSYHQTFLAIIDIYHNNFGYKCYSTPLWSIYDVYLLSKKEAAFDVLMKMPEFFNLLNSFFAMTHYLTQSESIFFIKSKKVNRFLNKMEYLMDHSKKHKIKMKIILLLEKFKKCFKI